MSAILGSTGSPPATLIGHKFVVVRTDSSFISESRIGAPQGSVIGPRSFGTYAEDVTNVFEQHRVRHHLFADDLQGIKHSNPSNVCDVTAGLKHV